MEAILTALVSRVLKKFIKSNDSTNDLRVRLSNGRVLLHNLDLNLDSLLSQSKLPICVKRAFARELCVIIPWTALGTSAMEITLDTVEVVLGIQGKQSANHEGLENEEHSGQMLELDEEDSQFESDSTSQAGGGKSNWLGSLLQTLGDVSLKVKNLVVKLELQDMVFTIMCGEFKIFTSFENMNLEEDLSQYFSKWLVMNTIVLHVAVLQDKENLALQEPLLIMSALRIHLLSSSPWATALTLSPKMRVFFEDVTSNFGPSHVECLKILQLFLSEIDYASEESFKSDSLQPQNVQILTERNSLEEVETGRDQRPESQQTSWLSFGTSFVSKTWDFVIDSEVDGDQVVSPNDQDLQLEKEMETNFTNLWSTIELSLLFDNVMINLVHENGEKISTLSVKGMYSELGILDSSLNLALVKVERIVLENLTGCDSKSLEKSVIMSCIQDGDGNAFRMELNCSEDCNGEMCLNVSVGKVWVGLDFAFFSCTSTFLKDCKKKVDSLSQCTDNLTTLSITSDKEKEYGTGEDISSTSSGVSDKKKPIKVKLQIYHIRVHLYYSSVLLSQFGLLFDNNDVVFRLNNGLSLATQIEYNSHFHLIQVNCSGAGNGIVLDRLNKASHVKGSFQQVNATSRCNINIESFTCCWGSEISSKVKKGIFDIMDAFAIEADQFEAVNSFIHTLGLGDHFSISLSSLNFSFCKEDSKVLSCSLSMCNLRLGISMALNSNEGHGVKIMSTAIESMMYIMNDKKVRFTGLSFHMKKVSEKEEIVLERGYEDNSDRKLYMPNLSIILESEKLIQIQQTSLSLCYQDMCLFKTIQNAIEARLLPIFGMQDVDDGTISIQILKVLAEINVEESKNGEYTFLLSLDDIAFRSESTSCMDTTTNQRKVWSKSNLSISAMQLTLLDGGDMYKIFALQRKAEEERCFTLSSVKTGKQKLLDKQVNIKLLSKLILQIDERSLGTILDLVLAATAKNPHVNAKEEQPSSTLTKVSLCSFELYFHRLSMSAKPSKRVLLASDGIILTIHPPHDNWDTDPSRVKTSEIDLCMLTAHLGVVEGLDGHSAHHIFLGPADLHWKFRFLPGSIVMLIDANYLPLKLYWDVHFIIPSVFYNLFKVIYSRLKSAESTSSENSSVESEKNKTESESKPFIAIALRGSEMRLDICGKQQMPDFMQGEGSAGGTVGSLLQVCCTKYNFAFHFWNSSLYTFTLSSMCELKVNNPATFTVERITHKFAAIAHLGFCYEDRRDLATDYHFLRSLAEDAYEMPNLLKFQKPMKGLSFGFNSETIVLNVGSCILDQIAALREEFNRPVPEGSINRKLLHLTQNITIENLSQIPLAFQQEGSNSTIVLPAQEKKNIAWIHPAYIIESQSNYLCVRYYRKGSKWERAIHIDSLKCSSLSVSLSEKYKVFLAVNIIRRAGKKIITVRPSHCIINCTQIDLRMKCNGLNYMSFNCESGLEASNLSNMESALEYSIDKGTYKELLTIEDTLEPKRSLHLSICLDEQTWSEPIQPLELKGNDLFPIKSAAGSGHGRVIRKFFGEVLSDHADTGQMLLRIHPALYVVNMLQHDVHVHSTFEAARIIPSGCTSSMFISDIQKLKISFSITSVGSYQGTMNYKNESGCFEATFEPTDKAQPAFKCFVWLDNMNNGSVKCMRLIPKVTYHNMNEYDIYISYRRDQQVESQHVLKIPFGQSLSFTCPDVMQHCQLAIGLEENSRQEALMKWPVVDLKAFYSANQAEGSHLQCSHLYSPQGNVLSVHIRRTQLPMLSSDNTSLDIRIEPGFYLANLCRQNLEVCCKLNSSMAICKKEDSIGLGQFSFVKDEGGQFTTTLCLRWNDGATSDAQKNYYSWSDPVDMDPKSDFSFHYIPTSRKDLQSTGVCCYTYRCDNKYVMLVYEEDFPPVLVYNYTSFEFEMCMEFTDDRKIVDSNNIYESRQNIPVGTSSPDFRMHFGYLQNSLSHTESEYSINPSHSDLIDKEVEAILSSADNNKKRTPLSIHFKRKDGDWSSPVPLGSSAEQSGIMCKTEYSSPTWIITLSDHQSSEFSPQKDKSMSGEGGKVMNLSISLKRLSLVYKYNEDCLDDEGNERRELPMECSLSGVSLEMVKVSRKDSSECALTFGLGGFHIGIEKPSRAIIWSKAAESKCTFLKALLHWHKSPLTTFSHQERNKDANIMAIENLELSLAKTKIRLEDSTLDFFMRLKKNLYQSSSHLPIESFILRENVTDVSPVSKPSFEIYQLPTRLYVRSCKIHSVQLLCTFRTGGQSELFPYTLDICDSPIVLQSLSLRELYTNRKIFLNALTSYYIAEGIGNAPQLVGSLGLLFNPLGIIQSIKNGVNDLIDIPVEGFKSGGPLRFVGGLGVGSVKFIGHVSGSILSSVSVFSSSSAKLLHYACGNQKIAEYSAMHDGSITKGMIYGVSDLYDGVRRGLVGVVKHPMDGYQQGQVLSGIGKGIFGVVASPVGGALKLIGNVAQGVLDTTGFDDLPNFTEVDTESASLCLGSSISRFQLICAELGESYRHHFHCPQAVWTQHDGIIIEVKEDHTARAVLIATDSAFHLFLDGDLEIVCSIPYAVSKVLSLEGSVVCISALAGADEDQNRCHYGKRIECTFERYSMQDFFHYLRMVDFVDDKKA